MTSPRVSDLLDFTGKAVLVTGGGAGIGAGIAVRFAEAGADVAISYRTSAAGAHSVEAHIEKLGRQGVGIEADVTDPQAVARLVATTVERLGRLDVLVNNVGIYPLASIAEMTAVDWEVVQAANLRSVFLCTQAAAAPMSQQVEGGAVVNVASIEAERTAPEHSHYNAAKAGVVMFTRSAAMELGPRKIRVNAVSPGLIWRPGIEEGWPEGVGRWRRAAPLERLGRPEDVADACLFLASSAARWITGVNLPVDGGILCCPAF